MSEKYNEYLKEHINNVKICYKLLTDKDLRSHDDSKYEKSQYNAYDIQWYGSEDERKKNEPLYDLAWLFHQHKEPHHWQYWVLQRDSGELEPLKMTNRYIHEMIADWASFSLSKKKPEELSTWYNNNKDNMRLHPETRKEVERLIPIMVSKMKNYLKIS